jgi:hypothetical protein
MYKKDVKSSEKGGKIYIWVNRSFSMPNDNPAQVRLWKETREVVQKMRRMNASTKEINIVLNDAQRRHANLGVANVNLAKDAAAKPKTKRRPR